MNNDQMLRENEVPIEIEKSDLVTSSQIEKNDSSKEESYKIKPSNESDPDNPPESLFEAYHAILSYLTGNPEIFKTIALKTGSLFYLEKKVKKKQNYKNPQNDNKPQDDVDYIFGKELEETHYKFHSHENIIYDPYNYFQLYNSHGNCFAFALYLSSILSKNGNKQVTNLLINISSLMEEKMEMVGKKYYKYYKVKDDDNIKKLMYKCVVYNDNKVINWLLNFIKSDETIMNAYREDWKNLDKDKKDHYGIPDVIEYSFDVFLNQMDELAKDITNTYVMTYDQIVNWDILAADNTPEYQNSGIEGAKKLFNDPRKGGLEIIDHGDRDFEFKDESEMNNLTKMGGRKKRNKTKKQKTKLKKRKTKSRK